MTTYTLIENNLIGELSNTRKIRQFKPHLFHLLTPDAVYANISKVKTLK